MLKVNVVVLWVLVVSLLCLPRLIWGQDYRALFSENLPVHLVLGYGQAKTYTGEANAMYRNQYSRLGSGVSSMSAAVQLRYDRWFMGGSVLAMGYGVGTYSKTSVLVNCGYAHRLSSNQELRLSLAAGFFQMRYNLDELSYLNNGQLISGSQHAVLSNTGQPLTSSFREDLGLGLVWNKSMDASSSWQWSVGTGLYHFHQPALWQAELNKVLPFRFTFLGNLEKRLSKGHVVGLGMRLSLQQYFTESQYHLSYTHRLDDTKKVTFLMGIRPNDALVSGVLIEYNRFKFNLGADFLTNSQLAANTIGMAIELGLAYRFNLGMAMPDTFKMGPKSKKEVIAPVQNPRDSIDRLLDSDKDGTPDYLDRCVMVRGEVSLAGCPDSDGDFISDLDDKCPYVKGRIDHAGCPLHTNTQGQVYTKPNERSPKLIILFDTDKHFVKSSYITDIERFAQFALEAKNQKFTIYLAGHTDNNHTVDYNYQLSQRRIAAVTSFLTSLGVPVGRIKSQPYGELSPVSENNTPEGKAQNRRVEVWLVED